MIDEKTVSKKMINIIGGQISLKLSIERQSASDDLYKVSKGVLDIVVEKPSLMK